jgi:periplasmic protein TonB
MNENACINNHRRQGLIAAAAAWALVVTGCKTAPPDTSSQAPSPKAPASVSGATRPAPSGAAPVPSRSSGASTAHAYRRDGASHLYGLNSDRIYKGRMPPLLYAVGVMNVEIDGAGRVTRLDWLRAPRHAPEVMAEIESTIRKASPFPAPTRLGKVVYTDTWLWHKSGKFQLDTLTEGQS